MPHLQGFRSHRHTRMSMITLSCRLIRKECAGRSRSTFFLPCLTPSAPTQLQEVSSFLAAAASSGHTQQPDDAPALLQTHRHPPCLRDGDKALERAVMWAEEIQRLLGYWRASGRVEAAPFRLPVPNNSSTMPTSRYFISSSTIRISNSSRERAHWSA